MSRNVFSNNSGNNVNSLSSNLFNYNQVLLNIARISFFQTFQLQSSFNKFNTDIIYNSFIEDLFQNIQQNNYYNNEKIKSPKPICPKCKKDCPIEWENDTIININCKCGHNKLYNVIDFEKTQYRNPLAMGCISCGKISADDKFYYCSSCNINYCEECKNNHENEEHHLYPYILKEYFCLEHDEEFNCYCANCQKNICFQCINKHKKKGHIIEEFDLNKKKRMKKSEESNNKFKEFVWIYLKVMNNLTSCFNSIVEAYRVYYKNKFNYGEIKTKEVLQYQDSFNIDFINNIFEKFINIDKEKNIFKTFQYFIQLSDTLTKSNPIEINFDINDFDKDINERIDFKISEKKFENFILSVNKENDMKLIGKKNSSYYQGIQQEINFKIYANNFSQSNKTLVKKMVLEISKPNNIKINHDNKNNNVAILNPLSNQFKSEKNKENEILNQIVENNSFDFMENNSEKFNDIIEKNFFENYDNQNIHKENININIPGNNPFENPPTNKIAFENFLTNDIVECLKKDSIINKNRVNNLTKSNKINEENFILHNSSNFLIKENINLGHSYKDTKNINSFLDSNEINLRNNINNINLNNFPFNLQNNLSYVNNTSDCCKISLDNSPIFSNHINLNIQNHIDDAVKEDVKEEKNEDEKIDNNYDRLTENIENESNGYNELMKEEDGDPNFYKEYCEYADEENDDKNKFSEEISLNLDESNSRIKNKNEIIIPNDSNLKDVSEIKEKSDSLSFKDNDNFQEFLEGKKQIINLLQVNCEETNVKSNKNEKISTRLKNEILNIIPEKNFYSDFVARNNLSSSKVEYNKTQKIKNEFSSSSISRIIFTENKDFLKISNEFNEKISSLSKNVVNKNIVDNIINIDLRKSRYTYMSNEIIKFIVFCIVIHMNLKNPLFYFNGIKLQLNLFFSHYHEEVVYISFLYDSVLLCYNERCKSMINLKFPISYFFAFNLDQFRFNKNLISYDS